MNMTLDELRSYVSFIKNAEIKPDREVVIAPPFTLLFPLFHMLEGSKIKIAAQNMYFEEKGAFTGEVSPRHILDAHAEYVIIGHSERRKIFGEDDALIAKKLKSAVNHRLIPIFCIGETKEERESGKTFTIIETQLKNGLSLCTTEEIANFVFAYEPVWAIGTGINATPEDAQSVHLFIKEFLQKNYFKSSHQNVKILYGGSVTPDNVDALMSMPDIKGVLVGGASLKPDTFLKIINFKER
jgi:triosephosphate isomerase